MTIHVARGNDKLGEFSSDAVEAGLKTGRFQPSDLVWWEGLGQWRVLCEVEELAQSGVGGSGFIPWDHSTSSISFLKTAREILVSPGTSFSSEGRWTRAYRFFVYAAGFGFIGGAVLNALFRLLLTHPSMTGFLPEATARAKKTIDSHGVFGLFGGEVGDALLFLVPYLTIPFIFAGASHFFLFIMDWALKPYTQTLRAYCYSLGTCTLFLLVPFPGCGNIISFVSSIIVGSVALGLSQKVPLWKSGVAVTLSYVLACGAGCGLFTLVHVIPG
jgi:hypothetical protein